MRSVCVVKLYAHWGLCESVCSPREVPERTYSSTSTPSPKYMLGARIASRGPYGTQPSCVHAACLGLIFPKVRREPINHELGVSPTTGSAVLRGGFRVRVRGLIYFLWLVKTYGTTS